MKLHSNNKALSSVIAASILLAAILTIATAFQAFIVPELDREQAFIHSQKILQNLKELYTKEATTIPLAYAGTPFFSATTYPGQISYTPAASINISAYNITIVNEEEALLNENTNITMQGLSEATLFLKNITDNIKASINFINNENPLLLKIHTEKHTFDTDITLIKIHLNITINSEYTTYNYTIFAGDSIELPLLTPLYGLASTLIKTTQVQYTTNSSTCLLFLKYLATTTTNMNYIAQGAITYKPGNFPLSYTTTPWGITALQSGTSAIPTPMQIYWTKDTLVLNLYNITYSNIGTISGSGSIGVNFKTQNQTSINSTISTLKLTFSYNQFNLKNSILQLKALLQNSAPENILISHEEGNHWLTITITGANNVNMKLIIQNIEALLS